MGREKACGTEMCTCCGMRLGVARDDSRYPQRPFIYEHASPRKFPFTMVDIVWRVELTIGVIAVRAVAWYMLRKILLIPKILYIRRRRRARRML